MRGHRGDVLPLQKATRELGDPVLFTEATRCLLEGTHGELEARGEVPLKGKSDPVTVYAPQALDKRPRSGRPSLATEV